MWSFQRFIYKWKDNGKYTLGTRSMNEVYTQNFPVFFNNHWIQKSLSTLKKIGYFETLLSFLREITNMYWVKSINVEFFNVISISKKGSLT